MVVDKSKDYIQQLAEHIKKNLTKGYTPDSLKFSLMSQGYSRLTVENAMKMANEQLAEKVPPMKERPQITYKLVSDNDTYVYEKKHCFFKRLLKIFKKD